MVEARAPRFDKPPAWSVLEGRFEPPDTFPDKSVVATMEQFAKSFTKDLETQQRIYYSDLLLYALEACQPELSSSMKSDKEQKMRVGNEVRNAISQSIHMPERDRVESLKRLSEEISPDSIPLMQALRFMQDQCVINHDDRSILDGAVRVLYIIQQKGQQ